MRRAGFALLIAIIFLPLPRVGRPLWPGARFTDKARDQAIRRGLRFIYGTATKAENFEDHGDDYLWCFYFISSTSADPELRRMARNMGRERAKQWRRQNPHVPPAAGAYDVYAMVSGSYGADRLGFPDEALKEEVRAAAARFRPEDFLRFDPSKEAVPDDVPAQCQKCNLYNPRGRHTCRRCGATLKMVSRYDLMCDALIATYGGDRYGVRLGASYPDVVQWMPLLRPYPRRDGGRNPEWDRAIYAVTHLVYTLNDYSRRHLRPEWLPDEFEFLKANLRESIAANDTESLGEFLDTLKSFGLTEADPLIRSGIEFVLSRQNADGSWGDPNEADIYDRYHPTWTAIDGLRDYDWQGEGVSFPEALRRITR